MGMAIPKHQFVVDDSGKKKAVILDIAEYQKLIEEAEELEAIRAYDAAKAAGDEAIPFEQAVTEIERDRQ
jgi:PHD/YefM family antitoxin component YafN of YafNO toxin-antitoxin module